MEKVLYNQDKHVELTYKGYSELLVLSLDYPKLELVSLNVCWNLGFEHEKGTNKSRKCKYSENTQVDFWKLTLNDSLQQPNDDGRATTESISYDASKC